MLLAQAHPTMINHHTSMYIRVVTPFCHPLLFIAIVYLYVVFSETLVKYLITLLTQNYAPPPHLPHPPPPLLLARFSYKYGGAYN